MIIKKEPTIVYNISADDLHLLITSTVRATIDAMSEKAKVETVWLNPDEVCSRLGVNRTTLWRWDREGYLKGTRFGRRLRFAEEDVARIEETEKGGRAK